MAYVYDTVLANSMRDLSPTPLLQGEGLLAPPSLAGKGAGGLGFYFANSISLRVIFMNYCVNPACAYPENPARAKVCHFCESTLLLRDRYCVTKALGQGGFGATFLATDLSLPNKPSCVIKQLRPTLLTPSFLDMAQVLFEREALTLKKIGNHPQIPQLLDYFEESQRFYLVLEYIPGLTIQQKIKQGGVFKEVQVKQFLNKMLPLLEYIHSQQVIHRDIKPANIIYRQSDKQWVLIDFGSVKVEEPQLNHRFR